MFGRLRRAGAVATVILPFFSVISAAESPLTALDVSRIRTVVQAVISPDGDHIAYSLAVPRDLSEEPDGAAHRELHVIHRQSGTSLPFRTGEVSVSSLSWTPDSGQISFLEKRGDHPVSLYAIPVDGGESRLVARLKSGISSYSWSPDGKQVALVSTEPRDEESEEIRKKGFNQQIYEEDWLRKRAWVVDAFEPKTDSEPLDLQGSAFSVRWSPAGKELAVALAPSPLVDDSYTSQRVHLYDLASKKLEAFSTAGKLGSFSWSPDGNHVGIIAADDENDPLAGILKVFKKGSPEPVARIQHSEGHISSFSWQSPKTLMYLLNEGVWTSFREAHIDGSGKKQLVKTGGPVWSDLSLTQDGQAAAIVASSPSHPREVFSMSHGDAEPRRLTNNNEWLSERQLAPQELIRYLARDGLELEGILIRPLEEVKGQRYPLVLDVHGGPESHVRNGWVTYYAGLGQTLAAKNVAVFLPNYRGSTGRGLEFSKLSQGDPAGKEFDDLVDAVDHFIQEGLADAEKIGVTGGSYGGYATAWCSTYYSDRFAAGVMFVGLSNKVSKFGTTDIPEEDFLVHTRKRPWDDWQHLLEQSPIYHAGQGQTPLLILHGQADPRVNVGQSRELYRHLKLRSQAPVRLVLYPGEGHGNRRAASRLDYNLRALRWFEHYLKGAGGVSPNAEIEYPESIVGAEEPE